MPKHCQALICCVLQKVTVPGSCIVSFEKSLLNPVKHPFVWNIPILTTIGSPESPASREWLMEAVHWSSLQWWIAHVIHARPYQHLGWWFSPSSNIWLVASKGWWMIMQSFRGTPRFPNLKCLLILPQGGCLHKPQGGIFHWFLEEFTGVASKQFTYSNQNKTWWLTSSALYLKYGESHVIGP